MAWDPEQYQLFSDVRARPGLDLIARLAGTVRPRRIVDLGCGTGLLTRALCRTFPGAVVIGIDNAPPMLEEAREGLDEASEDGSAPRLSFAHDDIAEWRPTADQLPDLVFSNAALHWIGQHERLLPRLLALTARGGTLAIQVPNNYASAAYTLVREAVAELDDAEELLSVVPPTRVLSKDAYWRLLAPASAEVDIWETEYLQPLTGAAPILDWLKGSTLVPVREVLDAQDWARLERRLSLALDHAYPREPDGRVLFPFRRIFMVARRAD